MSWRRLAAITRKELVQIMRNWATLVLITLMPAFLLILLAYALTADIHNVPFAVFDQDKSATARGFISRLAAGEELELIGRVDSMNDIDDLFQHNRIKAAVILGPKFSAKLLSMEGFELQVIIDGTEPQSGGFAIDHIVNRAEAFFMEEMVSRMGNISGSRADLYPIDLRLRTWFNPDLKSTVAVIPGLLSMVVGLPGLSVALSLAKEREHGTLEQLMTTPVGRAELMVGKMIPYIFGGLLNVFLTTLVARYWFGVPFHGNLLLFFGLSALFLFAILSMGMLIGARIHTQPAALALAFLLIFFPGFFMTGIFFPITSMPEEMRLEAMALPGSHYAVIARHAFVTGAGIDVLWIPGLALIVLGLGFTIAAAFLFQKRLG